MNQTNRDACDDERGNCKACGHSFNPHLIVAYDPNDLSKGGEMRCQVEDCDCVRTLSFDLSDEEWITKLDSLRKPPS
jgi:hypothetical protein